MNTQDAIVLMRRMEAAWPNIFAKNQDREKLYMDELEHCDYLMASKTINRLIGEMKMFPSIAELRQALTSHIISTMEPEFKDYGPGRTSENKPVATHAEAKAAFARGYRRAKPEATDEQIEAIFGGMKFPHLDEIQ